MKTPRADRNRVINPMEDVATRSKNNAMRRPKAAKKPNGRAGKTAEPAWECPTCHARKMFKRRHTH